MPPEEMTGSTHILEFMCYAIAGSAGIRFRMSSSRWVLAAAGSSVVRAAVFGYSSNKFLRINEDGPRGKGECITFTLASSGEGCFTLSLQLA